MIYPFLFHHKTRQVYNGPRTSNLSQQEQDKFWSKMIFEQNKTSIQWTKGSQMYKENNCWSKMIAEQKKSKNA